MSEQIECEEKNKSKALIEAENLKKHFPVTKSFIDSLIFKQKLFLRAVDGISFEVRQGETLGMVGESGCGKTTTGRLLTMLEKPTGGKIIFKNIDTSSVKGADMKSFRKKVQIVFQDPYASLNPRRDVYSAVVEPLIIHKIGSSQDDRRKIVYEMLDHVELKPPEDFASRYPYELSGGQRQRVAIARAMILHPEFIVADEPVSMLDISLRAGVLNLMFNLKEEFNITYLFITHDLSVARYVSDRIATMYLGKIVEMAPAEELIQNPMHPYTRLLISAVPIPDPTYGRQRVKASGEVPSSINIPQACRFHPRCAFAMDICKAKEPKLKEIGHGHRVACFLFDDACNGE